MIKYACPVWQSSLTIDEHRQHEAVQERVVVIISDCNDYEFCCALHGLELVKTRLDNLSRNFKTLVTYAICNY